ncbi:MAG: DUF1573 domain-containing protein [Planctomycetaceae bacterium]
MKSILALIGAFGVAGLLLAGVWMGGPDVAPPDEIVNAGPPGKAVVDQTEHAFETMLVGDKARHAFVIRNEGDGPLVLRTGKTSCKCTLSHLENGNLAAGESVEVELVWTAEHASPEFRQSAVINVLNDPDRREILLTVRGVVANELDSIPRDEWNVGTIAENRPTTVTGVVYSTVRDSFEILGVTGRSGYLSGEAVPLGDERLGELKAKCGYEIRATLEPEMPGRQFRETLVVRTDLPDREPLELHIVGNRPEPLEFLALAGFTFHSDARAIDLGQFEAKRGKSATLLIFIESESDVEMEVVSRDPDYLTAYVVENEEYQVKGKKQFRLEVAVPPGSPPLARLQRDSGKVMVKTTHPKLPELKFHVQFVAY